MKRILLVILLTSGIATCSGGGGGDSAKDLNLDEWYLVDTYIRIARARDMYSRDSALAETLFAAIDSTIDSTRIANIIEEIGSDPERWIPIFRAIDEGLRGAQPARN